MRMRRLFSIAILANMVLLSGAPTSYADHPHDGETDWAFYEGKDSGSGPAMRIEEGDLDSNGQFWAQVFTQIEPGGSKSVCELNLRTNLYDENGYDGDGNGYLDQRGICSWDGDVALGGTEWMTQFREYPSYRSQCVMFIGHVLITEPGAYSWDSDVRVYVLANSDAHDYSSWGYCQEEEGEGLRWLLLPISAGLGVIGVVIFIWKAPLSSRNKSEDGEVITDSKREEIEGAKSVEADEEKERSTNDESSVESGKEPDSLVDDKPSMFCPNCGKKNEVGGKFCKDCGTKLS